MTVFGARADGRSRIADPRDASRTFTWLPEVQIDSAGNALWFDWEPETLDGVDRGASFERGRPPLAQRYLKRVRYETRSRDDRHHPGRRQRADRNVVVRRGGAPAQRPELSAALGLDQTSSVLAKFAARAAAVAS